LGKCIICGKGTYKVLFSKAIEKIYICSEECLKEFHKPLGEVRIQKKLKESDGWLD
jgi:hypothetical protein